MFKNPAPVSIPVWQQEGFASPPHTGAVERTMLVYRITGHASTNPFGNCFFVPARDEVDPTRMDAQELDLSLNCAIWGNGYQTLHTYRLVLGAWYWRGAISQAGWVGRAGEYHEFIPPPNRPVRGDLEQVVLLEMGTGRVLAPAEVPSRAIHLMEQPIVGSVAFVHQGARPSRAKMH